MPLKPNHIVLCGDSFTWGDGADSRDVLSHMYKPDEIAHIDSVCFDFFGSRDEPEFGAIQQDYIQKLRQYTIDFPGDRMLSPHTSRWSNICQQHSGVQVHNMARSGNSLNGIPISLSMWIHSNRDIIHSGDSVTVMANITHMDRVCLVSKYDEQGTEKDLKLYKDCPQTLMHTMTIHNNESEEFLEYYNRIGACEFDFCYTVWLCEQICIAHGMNFVWSGPSEVVHMKEFGIMADKSHSDPVDSNWLNYSINWENNVRTVIPEFTDIKQYTRYCARNTDKNPQSPCGHYNGHGQALMGREFSKELLDNFSWFFPN